MTSSRAITLKIVISVKPTWSAENGKGRFRAYAYEDLKLTRSTWTAFGLKTSRLKSPRTYLLLS